jgi:acyl carrier protein
MNTRDQVRKFIATNFYLPNPDDLSDDASLLESGVIDSTGVLEVISFLEENFGFTVEEGDMLPDNLDSISLISAYVERRLAEAPRSACAE